MSDPSLSDFDFKNKTVPVWYWCGKWEFFCSKDQIAKNLIREDKQLNESDIEQMITSGRIIETDFGHLFDEIIINLSQDQTQRVSFKVLRVSKRYKKSLIEMCWTLSQW